MATIDLAGMSEHGGFSINVKHFRIQKPSMFSGKWVVRSGGKEVLRASKNSAFTRGFEIRFEGKTFRLESTGVFTREMQLQGRGVNCTFTPQHVFTRRAVIAGEWQHFEVVVFAMWLVALMWRRQSNSNAGS